MSGSSTIDPRFDVDLWNLASPVFHELWVNIRRKFPQRCEHPLDLIPLLEDGDILVGGPEMEWNMGYLIGFSDAVRMMPNEVIEEWVAMMERISFGEPWWEANMS